MNVPNEPVVITLSILGYKLDSRQNAFFNYLVPSVLGTVFYIAHLAIDLGCVYSQYWEGNATWAGLTILFLYLPVLGSFLLTVTSWMKPSDICSRANILCFFKKCVQHLMFPAWSMWRCAEKIFWSIEGWLALNDDIRTEALGEVTAPRTIEFYYFLQGFLHTVPQILLQMTVLILHLTDFRQDTITSMASFILDYVAGLSIIFNITQMALTTSLYQRFTTQKVGGRNYPWLKLNTYDQNFEDFSRAEFNSRSDTIDSGAVQLRKSRGSRPNSTFRYCTRDTLYDVHAQIELEKLREIENQRVLTLKSRRRSSACYLKPTNINTNDSNSDDSADETELNRPESEYDNVMHDIRQSDQVDFPRPIRFVKSVPEDDLIGKLVSFLWWFMFLTARFLSIVSFAYFYPRHIAWILALHFTICVAYLLYDAQTYIVRRFKAVYYVFIGLIYIFCIIEFKKKFHKYNKVYNAFCALVFAENLIMCFVWRNLEMDKMDNEWWFNYVFYVTIGSTMLGVMSLLLYNFVNRPEKVIIGSESIKS